jgi:hypothetical protein
MASLKKYFKKSADPPVQEHITSTKEKIRAFNSIVSILAQIQQGPPFQDNEMRNKNPPNRGERLQLKLSNAFVHLAVADIDVVAATLFTPEEITVMAWIQDQNSDDQDEPEAAQDTQKEPELMPKSKLPWDKISWLFASNTANDDMRPGSNYQGPCIIKAMPPTDYPKSDSKKALIQYLDNFPKKWWVQSFNLIAMYDQTHKWVSGMRQTRSPTFGFWLRCLPC